MRKILHRFTAWLRRERGEIDFERDVPPQQYHLTRIWDRNNAMTIGGEE